MERNTFLKHALTFPVFIFLLSGALVLSSCEIFFGSPRLREHPNDRDAQLSKIVATSSTTDSASLRFIWRNPAEWHDDHLILEETVLVWSKDEYPASPFPSFLNGYESKSFTTSGYHEQLLTALSPGIVIYAALYGKSQWGWSVPCYTQMVIPSSFQTYGPVINDPFWSTYECYIDQYSPGMSYAQRIDPATPSTFFLENYTSSKKSLLVYFNGPIGLNNINFTNSILNLNVSLWDGGTIHVYPVLFPWYPESEQGSHVYDILEERIKDTGFFMAHVLTDLDNPVNITSVMGASTTLSLYGFLIEAVTAGYNEITINSSTPTPSLDYDISYHE